MQRSRSRKLARVARHSSARVQERPWSKLVRHASIGAAVMAAISAARAQQADTVNINLVAASAQTQQTNATSANPAPAPEAAGTTAADQGGLQEVIVTATKRAENIQSIPLTISAISQASLENQNIQSFEDYAMAMPQVSFTNDTPGYQQIFMRGISASGSFVGDGSNPTVAVYLDDQPITTPNGDLDMHMYDINRLEVLPGPQGTLYGASSEAGTIRIITNKPDTTGFSAGYTTQLNTIYNGTLGGIAEGFVNIPISSNIAVRLVGWYERDSGFINNVPQTITFANGFVLNNAQFVQNHYNPVTTEGGRAEFKFGITDNWSINPTVITQKTRYDGVFGQETWKDTAEGTPIPSQLSVAQFAPEPGGDSFVDSALTVLGKIGNFDLTYAGAYLTRHTYVFSEYVDYTLAYEFSEPLWPKNPTMWRYEQEGYQFYSNELRIASPTDYPLRIVAGLFQQRETSEFTLYEPIPGLDPELAVGYGTPFVWNDAEYLDYIQRVDRNWAAFAEANWDITSHLTATVGFRRFRYDNTLEGFYGFGNPNVYWAEELGETLSDLTSLPLGPNGLPVSNPDAITGQQTCTGKFRYNNEAPCQDLNAYSEGWGSTPKFNLSYKFDPDRLVYATFSRGFRPGGPNRNATVPPFTPDYLSNYEIGWKTAWLDHHLIFNGALYYEQWKNFQFGYTGQFGIGLIANAGDADVKGAEAQLQWVVTRGLSLTAAVTYNDADITENYCGILAPNGQPITSNNCVGPGNTTPYAPYAPTGQKLPYTPLWKTNLSARYSWPIGNYTAFVEGDQLYQSAVWPFLETTASVAGAVVNLRDAYGQEGAYGITNFSLGVDKGNWEAELLIKNAFNRITAQDITAEIQSAAATVATYNVLAPPRLIGLQFSNHF
jgi:iron complex outermembrane recepter protein